MTRKGVEFTVQLIAPGLWQWQFQIGKAVTHGKTHAKLMGLATRRAECRIDRALRELKTVAVDL
jgi:hypothetical protein